MRECVEIEVVGPPRHHAVVVRALEEAGLSCRWVQPPPGRNGPLYDLTLFVHATGREKLAAEVVGQLQRMHPRLRVSVEGPC